MVDKLEHSKPLMGHMSDNPAYHGRFTLDESTISKIYELHDLRELIFWDTDVTVETYS